MEPKYLHFSGDEVKGAIEGMEMVIRAYGKAYKRTARDKLARPSERAMTLADLDRKRTTACAILAKFKP